MSIIFTTLIQCHLIPRSVKYLSQQCTGYVTLMYMYINFLKGVPLSNDIVYINTTFTKFWTLDVSVFRIMTGPASTTSPAAFFYFQPLLIRLRFGVGSRGQFLLLGNKIVYRVQ